MILMQWEADGYIRGGIAERRVTFKVEEVKEIDIPIQADSVLSPDFFYGGDGTGIYFVTNDDQYGRITFEKLDAMKLCRGEIMPYPFDYSKGKPSVWIYQIENSRWRKERFDYEKKYYGDAYEFGGNVNDMLTDFKHYLFSFHDQFIEVIARGFWFEKSESSLFGKQLEEGHPFLRLPEENAEKMTVCSLKCQIRKNPKPIERLIYDAQFCSQKLYEFVLELEGRAMVDHTVALSYRNGNLISALRGYFGRQVVEFNGVIGLEQVKPYIENYMKEVYERRKSMNK